MKFINDRNFQTVTKLDLEKFFQFLTKSSFKKQTKQLTWAGVISFYQYFLHLQEIGTPDLYFMENPVSQKKRKWKNDREVNQIDILTNPEIRQLLPEIKTLGYREYIIFAILVHTSMRINGLTNIMIEKVDMGKRLIRTWDKGKMRTYAFGRTLVKDLQNYLKIRQRIQTLHSSSKYLIFSNKGDKLHPRTISAMLFRPITELIKRKFNKHITAHSLRRSFKTNRTNLGQPREQIEALMNHKNGLDDNYNKPTEEMFLKWFDAYQQF